MYNMKIFGKDCSTHGRSCYDHPIFALLLAEDVLVRFWRLQILVVEKRILSLLSTMSQMGLIADLLVSWKAR